MRRSWGVRSQERSATHARNNEVHRMCDRYRRGEGCEGEGNPAVYLFIAVLSCLIARGNRTATLRLSFRFYLPGLRQIYTGESKKYICLINECYTGTSGKY